MELAFEQKQRSCLKRTAHLSLAQEQTQELIIPCLLYTSDAADE